MTRTPFHKNATLSCWVTARKTHHQQQSESPTPNRTYCRNKRQSLHSAELKMESQLMKTESMITSSFAHIGLP